MPFPPAHPYPQPASAPVYAPPPPPPAYVPQPPAAYAPSYMQPPPEYQQPLPIAAPDESQVSYNSNNPYAGLSLQQAAEQAAAQAIKSLNGLTPMEGGEQYSLANTLAAHLQQSSADPYSNAQGNESPLSPNNPPAQYVAPATPIQPIASYVPPANYLNNAYEVHQNNHKVLVSKPIAPIIVSQPGNPVVEVNSGPAAVVKAAPVFYKQTPGYIVRQEILNKHPAPVSLNPVYVKVFKANEQQKPSCPYANQNQPAPEY